jgi:hypothetical protein
MNLSKTIFWDVEYSSIDWEKNARFVIGRVLMYGTTDDWRAVQSFYGRDRIIDEMLQERNLDPKSLSFLSCIYEIPKNKFRCYTQIQSNPGHWTY